MEVLTALAVANGAYKTITTCINNGREISDCVSALSKWFDASADIGHALEQSQNPSMFDTLFRKGSIEAMAANAIVAKKKLEEQERSLREMIVLNYGVSTYKEMMALRVQLREKRKLLIYRRMKMVKALIDGAAVLLFIIATLGLGYVIYLMVKN